MISGAKAFAPDRVMQAARAGARLARRARPLHASTAVFAEAPSACGSGACATPRACASDASSASRDIAFKPAASGWGYSKAAAANWDRIFGQKGKKSGAAAEQGAAGGAAQQSGPAQTQSGAADAAPAGAAA